MHFHFLFNDVNGQQEPSELTTAIGNCYRKCQSTFNQRRQNFALAHLVVSVPTTFEFLANVFSQSNIRIIGLLTKIFGFQSNVFPYSFFFFLFYEMFQHTAHSFFNSENNGNKINRKSQILFLFEYETSRNFLDKFFFVTNDVHHKESLLFLNLLLKHLKIN